MAVRKFRLFSSGTGLDFGEFEVALVLSLRDLGCAFTLCLGDAGLAFGFEGAETAELVGVGGEVLDWGVVPGLSLGSRDLGGCYAHDICFGGRQENGAGDEND
jgi:hypothetical protein